MADVVFDTAAQSGGILSRREHPPGYVSHHWYLTMLRRNECTVCWFCQTSEIAFKTFEFFDKGHKDPHPASGFGLVHYRLGRIGKFNIVVVFRQAGEPKLNLTALEVRKLCKHFPNLRLSIFIGLGSGLPTKDHDIQLGDVVVDIPFVAEKSTTADRKTIGMI